MKITLAGMGNQSKDLTLAALDAALEGQKQNDKIFVKSGLTPCGKSLILRGINAFPLDEIFERTRNYDTLNKKLADQIIKASKESQVIYFVDGDPKDDISCQMILKRVKDVEVIPGISKASFALNACHIGGKYTALSAYDINLISSPTLPIVVYDIDNPLKAGEVKLWLSDNFGDETPCYKLINGKVLKMPIYQTDWETESQSSIKTQAQADLNIERRTEFSIVVDQIPLIKKTRFNLSDLYEILEVLRSPEGCPWDKAQTKDSILMNTIEETYELVDAVKNNDEDGILEEVGDVILQAVFQIAFAEDRMAFNRIDAISAICSKLICRHSHIFGCDTAKDASDALNVWDKNKQKEKGYTCGGEYLEAVPKSLPSLMRAEKVMNRAKKYNFEFEEVGQIFDKILEECQEVKAEIKSGDSQKLKEECGDLLCAATNLVRFLGVECEEALTLSTEKFISRFKKLEQLIINDGKDMKNLTPSEIDKYYNAAKKS